MVTSLDMLLPQFCGGGGAQYNDEYSQLGNTNKNTFIYQNVLHKNIRNVQNIVCQIFVCASVCV